MRVGRHVLRRAEVDVAPLDHRAGSPRWASPTSRAFVATAAMRWIVSSIDCGPWLQFAPITGTSHDSRVRTTSSGCSPRIVVPSSLNVSETITGSEVCARTARESDARLVERRHRLQDEEVHAAFEQALDLLAVRRLGLVDVHVAEGNERLPDRADRSRDEGAAARGLARDPRRPRG